MDRPIRRPEEILAYRPLSRILAARSKELWTVSPADSAFKAVQLMAEKDIGFLVVLERDAVAGVLSERDCARRLVLARLPAETTPVGEIMVRDVISVEVGESFAHCLGLMHRQGIRHLPVTEKGRLVAVLSIRDLMAEAVNHHARIISELERERLTIFTSTA
jgi:CBS domain-containing protein